MQIKDSKNPSTDSMCIKKDIQAFLHHESKHKETDTTEQEGWAISFFWHLKLHY